MQKTSTIILLFSISGLIISSCFYNSNSKNVDSWIGNYSYEEEPIKAVAGYPMVMTWTLSINKSREIYKALLEINGQQTYIKLLADISGDSNSIVLKFDKLLEGPNENITRGDTLFSLIKKDNNLKTKWLSLQPRLEENPPKEYSCFQLNKNNDR